jgi:ribosomal protein S17E
MFAYNNSVHTNIKKTSYELLKKYIVSFAETFENKVLKRKTFLIIK